MVEVDRLPGRPKLARATVAIVGGCANARRSLLAGHKYGGWRPVEEL